MASKDKVATLMTEFTISTDRAQEILDAYFEKYPGVKQYIEDTTEFVKKNGYSITILGRKRRVPAVNSTDSGVAERAIRQAVNSTIQATASDCLMLSACAFQEFLDEHPEIPIRILSPIHDALYLEVREDFLLEGRDLLLKFMTTPPETINCPIPLRASAEWGRSWDEFSEDFGETLAVANDEYEEDTDEEEDN